MSKLSVGWYFNNYCENRNLLIFFSLNSKIFFLSFSHTGVAAEGMVGVLNWKYVDSLSLASHSPPRSPAHVSVVRKERERERRRRTWEEFLEVIIIFEDTRSNLWEERNEKREKKIEKRERPALGWEKWLFFSGKIYTQNKTEAGCSPDEDMCESHSSPSLLFTRHHLLIITSKATSRKRLAGMLKRKSKINTHTHFCNIWKHKKFYLRIPVALTTKRPAMTFCPNERKKY